MSEAFERFLAGEDRLVGLLRELPAYAPSAEFEAKFAAATTQAQASAGAARGRSDNEPLNFEPPASLEANFLKMAASIDSAQAPRREALLAQISKGDTPQAALGAALQPATAEWLQTQATQRTPATVAKPARKTGWLGFSWFDLRIAGLACILAAAATQLVLKYAPTKEQIAAHEAFQAAFKEQQTGEPERRVAEAKPVGVAAPATRKKSVVSEPLPAARPALSPAAPQLAQQPTRASAPEKETDRENMSLADVIQASNLLNKEELAPAARYDQAAPPAQPRLAAISTPPTPQAAPILAEQASKLESEAASPSPHIFGQTTSTSPRELALDEIIANQAPAKRAARAEFKASDAPRPAAAAPAAAVASARLSSPTEQEAPTLLRTEPTPAKADATPMPETPATQLQIRRNISSADLSEDPASVAARLPARPAGLEWLVYCVNPSDPELLSWLEALRQRMPAMNRAASFKTLREPALLSRHQVRIAPPP